MKKLMIALSLSLFLSACAKDDDGPAGNTQILRYEQTSCADAWGGNQTDSATLANLRTYLDSRGLYHSNEVIKTERGPDLCNACSCRTGKVIYVRTVVSQQQSYFNLRFTL